MPPPSRPWRLSSAATRSCHNGAAMVALSCGSATPRSRISSTRPVMVAGMMYARVHRSAARMSSTSLAMTRRVTTLVPPWISTGMP